MRLLLSGINTWGMHCSRASRQALTACLLARPQSIGSEHYGCALMHALYVMAMPECPLVHTFRLLCFLVDSPIIHDVIQLVLVFNEHNGIVGLQRSSI